jgi:hypothetical protein
MRKALFNMIVSVCFISVSMGMISVFASGPAFWRVNSRDEVEKGDLSGVSVADNGAMTPAPSLAEVFDAEQAYIWSAVTGNVRNIYPGGFGPRLFCG